MDSASIYSFWNLNGVIWAATIQAMTTGVSPVYISVTIIFILIGWQIKRHYWAFIDNTHHGETPNSATGLNGGKVTFLEGPHTEENYLLSEMGFQIARKNAKKLRRYVYIWAFAVPLAALIISYFLSNSFLTISTLVAALSSSAGILISRWLFFAEARHVVTLYYGAKQA